MRAPPVRPGSCRENTWRRSATTGFKKAPIGAGPYRYVSFVPGVELVLEAFDGLLAQHAAVKRLVLKVIPDESTRLAALKRGEIDIAYSIRGELAGELLHTPGSEPQAGGGPGHLLRVFRGSMGSEIALARYARAAGRRSCHRPQDHQRGADHGVLACHRQRHLPGYLRVLLAAAGAGVRSCAGKAVARRGRLPQGFDAGFYNCDSVLCQYRRGGGQ